MRGCLFVVFSAAASTQLEATAESKPTTEDVGCTITAKVCANFPQFSRTQFRDSLGEEHYEAGSNEAVCLRRAEDFHHWCGNSVTEGAQVAATYNPKRWSQVYHPGACGKGWSQWDAFCYKYYWEMKTWPEAESLCRQRESHLVSIHSQAENRFVAHLQQGLKGWIGYTDIDNDTHYQWSDNTQDDFTNFVKNCTGRELEPDCKPQEVQQQWYTSKGTATGPYTCKRNAFLPLALLKNMSAQQLLDISWSELLPALADASVKDFAVRIVGDTVHTTLPLKVPDVPIPKTGESGKPSEVNAPKAHFGLPKGSFF